MSHPIKPILITVSGSRAYGVHTEHSDYDIKGVMVPKDYESAYYGLVGNINQNEYNQDRCLELLEPYLPKEEIAHYGEKGCEGTLYEIRKFFRLIADCNPNIMDVVFCDSFIYKDNPVAKKILDNRDKFVTAKAKHTYSGYAMSQLKRIKSHRKWILEPPDNKPKREDFGLPAADIPQQVMDQYMAMVRKQLDTWEHDLSNLEPSQIVHIKTKLEETLLAMNIANSKFSLAAHYLGIGGANLDTLLKEKEYQEAVRNYKNYQNWKKNRNPARAELEKKSGYDTKHAMHLVRLLRMGKEILLTGEVRVNRTDIDADELLDIRNGGYSYEEIVERAEVMCAEVDSIYRDKKYIIPHSTNVNEINDLLIECVKMSMEL